MSGTILSLITIAAALFLAIGGLRSDALPRRRLLIMAAAWIGIIGLLALVLTLLGVTPHGGVE
jgi:MFS family permease